MCLFLLPGVITALPESGRAPTGTRHSNTRGATMTNTDYATAESSVGTVVALYNAGTDGDFPVYASGSTTYIAQSTSATPQLFVLRTNGTDAYGGVYYNFQTAEGDGKYLRHSRASSSSLSTTATNYLLLNTSATGYSGYSWGTGSCPSSPYYTLVAYMSSASKKYCSLTNNKSYTGWQGWSRTYNNLYYTNGARLSSYNTRWVIVAQPYTVYDLSVTGLDDVSDVSVIYSNDDDADITRSAQTNGGFFAISDEVTPTASMFSATEVDGYDCTISISGTTVTVTYSEEVEETTQSETSAYSSTIEDGKVYALYNVCTDGAYPIYTNSSSPAISTSVSTTPQFFVMRASGTDAANGTYYNLQCVEGDGNYLAWTNGSPSSVTYSTSASNFVFPNSASSGYTWTSGSAPTSPLVNLLGYYGSSYTVFCDNKSTSSTSFNGYSNKSYSTLLNNTQAAKGSVYNTTWGLILQPYILYTVSVSGLSDNSTAAVTYTNSSDAAFTRSAQANGGFFAISEEVTPDASMFSATEVDGYNYAVSISGTTVSVSYTEAYTDYTVAVSGLSDNSAASVSYDGTSATNGGTLSVSSGTTLTASMISATDVDGYTYTVSIDGTTINVVYTETYTAYTVAVSGLSDNSTVSVSYDGTSATNGGTISISDLVTVTSSLFTATEVDGYTYTITVAGTTVNVVYTETYTDYTIAVSGLSDNSTVSVSYDGTSVTNGDTISISDLVTVTASLFTATDVDGYTYTVSIDGTTINVVYTETYTDYTVAVSGLSDNSTVSVSYAGTSATNGGTISISDLITVTSSLFTATDVDGYTYTITVDGTTINVVYTETETETETYAETLEDGKVYALYNVCTDDAYPVISNSGTPGIATSSEATPQYFVMRANGTDGVNATTYNLQLAEGSGYYLAWTNGSPTSVAFSTTASTFVFLNDASTGYTWSSGSAPTSPLVNLLGYYSSYYTVFCDNKSTTSTSFNGYSYKSYSTLLNNTQASKGSVFNTTWGLILQPYTIYDVNISGLSDNSEVTVTYANSSDAAITRSAQTDGGFFAISDEVTPDASMFTASEVSGYTSEVSISGTAINVVYTSSSSTTTGEEVDITYVYTYDDATWYTETKTATVGDAYPDLYACPSGVLYTTIPSGTVTTAETVTITCALRDNYWITPSSSYDNASWFYLTIHDTSPSYLYYVSDATQLSYTSAPANSDVYKWAFLGNPFSGYKIINKAAGSTMILTSTDPTLDDNTGGDTYPHLVTESDIDTDSYNIYWDFTDSNAGFLLSRKDESVYCNKRNSSLAYWTSYDAGSRMYVVPVEDLSPLTSLSALVDAEGTSVSSSNTYRLVNRYTGKAIDGTTSVSSGSGNYWLTPATPASDDGQAWTVTYSSGFQLQNASTSEYISGSNSGWWYYGGITSESSTSMYFYEATTDDGIQYYYLSPSSSISSTSSSSRTFLSDGGSYIYPYTSDMNLRAQWYLEEISTASYESSITSGSYYRIVNNSYPTKSMADAGEAVVTVTTNEDSYAQLWKISGSNGSYKLQNVLTGRYIGTAPGTSAQWSTVESSDDAGSFYSGTTTSDDNTVFWFATSNSTSSYNALHSSASQSYYVVGWAGSSDASKWLLQEVSLSSDDLTTISDIQSAVNADYTSTLNTYFSDYACTELRSTYASYTDDELRNAMSSLPETVQEMAVYVKNDTWNSNSTWNSYEKDFRIHEYEIFSEPSVWASVLGYGPFGRLTQPTGIKLAANEVAYIFVDEDVADSDAQLFAELVCGVDVMGTQTALQKGYNAVLANSDCELFITYNCTNTERALSEFPDIKIHVEGGSCNGFFDLSRGHTNNDWYWLAGNMFSDEYLHVKGNSTILNCYLSRVQDASQVAECMQIWDFVFDTEEDLMVGSTYDGYYRPFICNRDITSGNPYWTSNGTVGYTNYAGIYSTGLLNFNTLVYSGTNGGQQWVIEHEEGHGHQDPFNVSGATEVNNNGLAQMVNHLWGYRTSRGIAQQQLVWFFNNGFSWIDLMRAANKYGSTYMNSSSYNTQGWTNVGSKSIWLANKLWYQLWLYFHLQGDDEFFPRFIAKIAEYGGIVKSTSKSSPASYKTDYMRMALAACDAAETDLYEFFKAWGFFNYGDAINTNSTIYTSVEDFANLDGTLGDGIYAITDYSTYYVQMPLSTNSEDVEYLEECKATMQSYTNKAPGILFINDTGELTEITADDVCSQYDASLIGQSKQYSDANAATGEGYTGHYSLYGSSQTASLSASLSDTTITVTGDGAVGYKIYDSTGEMIYISMSNEFTVTSAIASELNANTNSLVATLGDGTELVLLGATSYTQRMSADDVTAVDGVKTNIGARPTTVFDLQGRPVTNPQRGQVYMIDGKKVRY